MSEKRFSVIKTNTGNFVFDSEKLLTSYQVADLLNSLCEENEQLRQTNEKLRWDLEKTRKDLDFFATLKVTAMKGCEPNE